MVDLGSVAMVHFIRIFNREAPERMQRRASPLLVEASNDDERWILLFQTYPDHLFGGYSGEVLWCGALAALRKRGSF